MSVSIATWNVNSVRARLPNIIEWLQEAKPDIVCLQELKCETDKVPYMELEDLGYNVVAHGQKTYNGVAILSKFPIDEVVHTALPGDDEDEQARYIEAVISAEGKVLRVASIYVPNGGSPDGERWSYKMSFYDRLYDHAQEMLGFEEISVLAADYNVAPRDIDVHDPSRLRGTTCFHPDEQKKFDALLFQGWTDAYRTLNPTVHQFSWWDYRGGSWPKNLGMRIDHLLLSPQAADMLEKSWVDEGPRGKEKASDHAPVLISLDL